MSEYRLVMKGVVKTFPGVKALDHAQLELRPGKVMALMGENGAGKSTLMKCMFGIYKMDEGEIEYEGEKANIPNPLEALNRGIAMVHQELQPIPARTVAENIWLGRYPTKKAGPITIVDHAKMYKDTDALLKKLKLDINSHAKLGSLSIAQMQMVEIAKAVSANCKVLILDEPTSSLTANEVESLFRIMRELKEQGVALVYISHKMDEIKVIADEVTIMRDGHYIGKWDVASMTKEQIIAKMVGRELSNLYPPLENHPSDEVMMKVEDFTSIHPRSFRHCSFELKKRRDPGRGRSGGCPAYRADGGHLRPACPHLRPGVDQGRRGQHPAAPRRHPEERGSADGRPPCNGHHGRAERGR